MNIQNEIILRCILWWINRLFKQTTPYKRPIPECEYYRYQYPTIKGIFPNNIELYIIIALPTIIAFMFYLKSRDKNDLRDFNLAYSLAIAITMIITNILKVFVGRPRPDFLLRCEPDENMICTGKGEMYDGRKSFPSGHSSAANAAMAFLCLYFAGKLNIFNKQGRGTGWKIAFCLSPLMISLSVACSRMWNYRHHWEDVYVGALLGIAISYLCYRQYYPSLEKEFACKPYSSIVNEEHPKSKAKCVVHVSV